MKVVIFNPRDEYNVARGLARFRSDAQAMICPPLGLLTIAAYLPPDWKITFIDENVTSVRASAFRHADLVLTGSMYTQRRRCRFWIRELRRMNKLVVVGGPDVSEAPLAYREATHRILGEAEVAFPQFLVDFQNGQARPVYRGERFEPLDESPIPRFDLLSEKTYPRLSIQFGRGCPFLCEFCAIPVTAGRAPRTKTPGRIIQELEHIRLRTTKFPRRIYVVDDNLISNRVWFRSVMEAVAEYQKEHGYPFAFDGYVSLNIVNDDTLLECLVSAGFRLVFIGIESPDPVVLDAHRKYQNQKHDVVTSIRKFHARGIAVVPGLVMGNDQETPPVAPSLVSLLREAGLPPFVPSLLFAQPHTPLTERLQRDGRMLCECDKVDELDDQFVHCGLNFVTLRPREEILQDFLTLLRVGFSTREYFRRVSTMVAQFGTARKTSVGPVAQRASRRGLWRGLKHLLILFAAEPQCTYRALKLLIETARQRPELLGMCLEQVVLFRTHRLFARGRQRNAENALSLARRASSASRQNRSAHRETEVETTSALSPTLVDNEARESLERARPPREASESLGASVPADLSRAARRERGSFAELH